MVVLDGHGSFDGNGDPLTFRWSLVSKPTTSLAEPDTSTPAASHFVADGLGGYLLSLMVHGRFVHSAPSSVTMGQATRGELHRPHAGALEPDIRGPGQGRG